MVRRIHPESQREDDKQEIEATRARELEVQVGIRERVAVLEREVTHLATKFEVERAKLWSIGTLVTAIAIATGLILRFD